MSIDRWMGRDDVVNIHTATSLGHHKGWNEAIYNEVGEVERTYAQWTQSVRERQISNTIQLYSQVNFNKPNKLARGLMGWDERSKPRNSLLTTENKLIDTRGRCGGMGNQAMGIVEGTCDQTRHCIQGLNQYVVNLKLYHIVFTNRNSLKV